MPNIGETLLELLKHTDADTLLVLLKPENILVLLKHEGWSDEQIKTALKKEKKPPGELLLNLFTRGRKAKELLEILGPKGIAQVEAERLKKPTSPTASGISPKRTGLIFNIHSKSKAVICIIGGLVLAIPTAWYLFIRLDVLHVPGLIRYFPRVYIMGAMFLLFGLLAMSFGIFWLVKNAVTSQKTS